MKDESINHSAKGKKAKYILGLRKALGILLAILILIGSATFIILQSKIMTLRTLEQEIAKLTFHPETQPEPFPVSVNPQKRTFDTNKEAEEYVKNYHQEQLGYSKKLSDRLFALVYSWQWYQNIATPNSRVLVILPGERKEEITDEFKSILKWNDDQAEKFADLVTNTPPAFPDGTFTPGKYIVRSDASAEFVANLVTDRFSNTILSRYPHSIETQVPLKDALTIASLLERESYHFEEMQVIAGIIWNRIFINMPLQIDATMQYAKANAVQSTNWWPVPRPNDKFIDSPFNTYQNTGLPPYPIANPESSSILAALNPTPTNCLYYFHNQNGDFYCSATYQEHISELRRQYGQGK